eukprot:8318048-Alexandrium_andersonii.AAC.1
MLRAVSDHLSGIRAQRDATIQQALAAGGVQGDGSPTAVVLGGLWDSLLHKLAAMLNDAATAAG